MRFFVLHSHNHLNDWIDKWSQKNTESIVDQPPGGDRLHPEAVDCHTKATDKPWQADKGQGKATPHNVPPIEMSASSKEVSGNVQQGPQAPGDGIFDNAEGPLDPVTCGQLLGRCRGCLKQEITY